jgi:hypothetical protein
VRVIGVSILDIRDVYPARALVKNQLHPRSLSGHPTEDATGDECTDDASPSMCAVQSHGVKGFFIFFHHRRAMAAHSWLRGLSQGLAIVALAACGLLTALMGGPASGPLAAVFPPWWDGIRTVNAAVKAGTVLRLGPLNFVVLVSPDDPHGRERLWRAGAWLLLNPRGLPGCGPEIGVKSNGDSSAARG